MDKTIYAPCDIAALSSILCSRRLKNDCFFTALCVTSVAALVAFSALSLLATAVVGILGAAASVATAFFTGNAARLSVAANSDNERTVTRIDFLLIMLVSFWFIQN